MTEQRLIDLEVKISHQEVAIEALQLLVYEHEKSIGRLEGALQRLAKRWESLADPGPELGAADEKPPHY